MKFVLLMAEQDHFARWDASSQRDRDEVFAAFEAFGEAVAQRGSVVGGEGLLAPDQARTLSPVTREVTEGPYAETAEQVGGFFVIDVPDLDAAVELGGLLPPQFTVEVRPALEVEP